MENLLLLSDSYKVSHAPQYPEGTERIYSYFESRGGAYPGTIFFGLQYIMEKYLVPGFKNEDIEEATEIYAAHFGNDKLFNRAGWRRMLYKHHGKLPVVIKAVPEGTYVPNSNVLMTVENTDNEFPWLTNYLETLLSQVWYPTTVATISWFVRNKILDYLKRTGTPEAVDFKLQDFGFRGVSSVESAGIGGAAHLTSFMGSDTVAALTMLRKYYDADMPGFSIPASEHSTITSWGRENEIEAYRNMIKTYGDQPFYAVVSDSYNIYNACEHLWGEELHDEVLNADGTLVVRPDSGDPGEVVLRILEILGDKFGWERNEKDYKVLNPKVRIIWGDGLEPRTIESIMFKMSLQQWSIDNIAFGMGGGLLQKVNRDTQRFAFKCSSITIDGEERDVYKEPVGMVSKNSKRGRLALAWNAANKSYVTVPEGSRGTDDILKTVFKNGEVTKRYTLADIKKLTTA